MKSQPVTLSTSTLNGTTVRNTKGEALGHIDGDTKNRGGRTSTPVAVDVGCRQPPSEDRCGAFC